LGNDVLGDPLLLDANVVAPPTCEIGWAARQSSRTVVGPVPVTVRLDPWQETVIAVLAVICSEGVVGCGDALLTEELVVDGRSAIVADTEPLPDTWGQSAEALGPEVVELATAAATWELPSLLTVAPRIEPGGAAATICHASLPSPSTRAVPAVSVVTLGEVAPAVDADASTGFVVLTPENAIVTIETWVGGLTVAPGFAW
jgi:hypothetical protein